MKSINGWPGYETTQNLPPIAVKDVAYLRGFQSSKLGKSGDSEREQVLVDATFRLTAENTCFKIANLTAAVSAKAPGNVMNIACGTRWSLLELLNTLEETLQCDATPVFHERRPGDILHSQASIDKAREVMNSVPQTSFAEGLKETVEWVLGKRQAALTVPEQAHEVRYAQA